MGGENNGTEEWSIINEPCEGLSRLKVGQPSQGLNCHPERAKRTKDLVLGRHIQFHLENETFSRSEKSSPADGAQNDIVALIIRRV